MQIKLMILSILMALSMFGCKNLESLDDGYQVGDLTKEAIKLQNDYCQNGDITARFLLRAMLDQAGVLPGEVDLCQVDLSFLVEEVE